MKTNGWRMKKVSYIYVYIPTNSWSFTRISYSFKMVDTKLLKLT